MINSLRAENGQLEGYADSIKETDLAAATQAAA